MRKTNFTKVESLLDKGIKKQRIDDIVDETRPSTEAPSKANPKLFLVESIRYDLAIVPHYDKNFFKVLGISKKELLNLIKNPRSLTEKDWDFIAKIRKKMDARKEEIAELLPKFTDEEIIGFEKELHIYKRFNVNELWLPLH